VLCGLPLDSTTSRLDMARSLFLRAVEIFCLPIRAQRALIDRLSTKDEIECVSRSSHPDEGIAFRYAAEGGNVQNTKARLFHFESTLISSVRRKRA